MSVVEAHTRRLEVSQAYLARADVLRLLQVHGHSPLPTLRDLASVDRARHLRDALIEDDLMAIAMEVVPCFAQNIPWIVYIIIEQTQMFLHPLMPQVATKCGLDTHDVWAAWGLADLRLGAYAEAREKFKRCLTRGEVCAPWVLFVCSGVPVDVIAVLL